MLLLKLAFRNLLRQRRRTALTLLSMTGGYILCCLSFSLTDGSYKHVIRIFTMYHTGHIQIHQDNYLSRPKIFMGIEDNSMLREKILSQPGVQSLAPRIFAPALAYADNRNTAVQIVGIEPQLERTTSRLLDKLKQGQFMDLQPNGHGYYPAMLGIGVAESLRVSIGDEIILISQGADGSIANDIYTVTALVGTRNSWDRNKVYLPLLVAQDFLSLQGKVHQYSLLLNDENEVERVSQVLTDALPTLTINPWMEVEATFFNSMEADKRGNLFTLTIVVFIVFIGVLNTVLMSVLERTQEFGVLKAIGSRPAVIAALILTETLLLAIFSVTIGIIIAAPIIAWFALRGVALPNPIDMGGIEFGYLAGDFSVSVFGWPMLLIIAFSVLVSIPPGLRAARVSASRAMSSY